MNKADFIDLCHTWYKLNTLLELNNTKQLFYDNNINIDALLCSTTQLFAQWILDNNKSDYNNIESNIISFDS